MVATLGLVVGCGGSDDASDASFTDAATDEKPAISTDPKQALSESVKGIAEGNFTFALADYNANGSGSVHAASRSAHKKVAAAGADAGQLEMIAVDNDRWIKLSGVSAGSDTWLHVEASKISGAKAL